MRTGLRQLASSVKDGLWRQLQSRDLAFHRAPRPGADLRNPTSVDAAAFRAVLRELLTRLEINCVLDVGAHEGGYGRLLREIGYRGEIVSFEPASEPFSLLSVRSRQDGRWRAHRMALGDRSGSRILNVTRERNFSSFLAPGASARTWFPGATEVEREEAVAVVALDEVFHRLTDHVPDLRPFLKVDTQGFDVQVLHGAAESLEWIRGVQIELSMAPLYEGQPDFRQTLSEMEAFGFESVHLAPVARDDHLRIIEVDCLMRR